jgi:hypothetical protein
LFKFSPPTQTKRNRQPTSIGRASAPAEPQTHRGRARLRPSRKPFRNNPFAANQARGSGGTSPSP